MRLVWASSAVAEQIEINPTLFHNLIAPFSVISIPDASLEKFIGQATSAGLMPVNGGDCDRILAASRRAGLDVEIVAQELQSAYIDWLSREWIILLENIARKSARIAQQENSIEQGEMA